MKTFAHDLGMSPQNLNQVLPGKIGLSPSSAQKVLTQLNLEGDCAELFLSLVEANHGRNKVLRDLAAERAQSIQKRLSVAHQPGDRKSNEVHLNWIQWAAYFLVQLEGFEPNYDWAAAKLGIELELARSIYQKLFVGGFLSQTETGAWVHTDKRLSFASGLPSPELRDFYRSLLQKAAASLDEAG